MTTKGQVRVGFPAWRVYVFGVDVTNDVTSITTNTTDERTPSSCEIVLTSPDDRYVITDRDIETIYGDIVLPPNTTLQTVTEAQIDEEQRNVIPYFIADQNKKDVILVKTLARNTVDQPDPQNLLRNDNPSIRGRGLHQYAALKGDALRFPFQVGSCIFHTTDPVTVFLRDPMDLKKWYWGFRGIVSDWRTRLGVNGEREVTLSVEGVLRFLRLARLATNWAIHDIEAVSSSEDTLFRTWYGEGTPNLTLPELFYLMVFGPQANNAEVYAKQLGVPLEDIRKIEGVYQQKLYGAARYEEQTDPTLLPTNLTGAGAFNFRDSEICYLPDFGAGANTSRRADDGVASRPIAAIDSDAQLNLAIGKTAEIVQLHAWQSKIDAELPIPSNTSHEEVMRVTRLYLHLIPESNQRKYGPVMGDVNPRLEGSVDEQAPRSVTERIYHALKACAEEGGDPTPIMDEIGMYPQVYPVMHGRLMMLLPASLAPGINRDLIHKDFVPGIASKTQFGSRLQALYNICERLHFSIYDSPRGDIVVEPSLHWTTPEDYDAPEGAVDVYSQKNYSTRYKFNLEDVQEYTSHFSDEKIKTIMASNYSNVKGVPGLAGDNDAIMQAPGTVKLEALIPQFGARLDYAPFHGSINDGQAAGYNALLALTKNNASAWTERVTTIYRAGLQPNRTVYLSVRDSIITIRRLSSTIRWGKSGSVTQSFEGNYRRGWSGLVFKDKAGKVVGKLYEAYGGRAASPIDYSLYIEDPRNIPPSTKAFSADREKFFAFINERGRGDQTSALRSIFQGTFLSREEFRDFVRQIAEKYKPVYDAFITPSGLLALENIVYGAEGVPGESAGGVGRLNYTFPSDVRKNPAEINRVLEALRSTGYPPKDVWAAMKAVYGDKRSRAVGIGQLMPYNYEAYGPNGLNSIGDPEAEIQAMMNYILRAPRPDLGNKPYGTPEAAWEYKKNKKDYTY